jgi:protein SCO1/2
LLDHTGSAFHRDHLQGKWTFIYFGYTSCPDACPLTLVTLHQVQQRLAQEGVDNDNAYLLVSVDPDRDTPERLGAYTTYFNPKFVGATGTPEELAQLAQQCLVVYRRSPGQGSEANYLIDHSSNVVLIDPQARLHAIFRPPHTPEALVADFRKIRAYAQVHTPR